MKLTTFRGLNFLKDRWRILLRSFSPFQSGLYSRQRPTARKSNQHVATCLQHSPPQSHASTDTCRCRFVTSTPCVVIVLFQRDEQASTQVLYIVHLYAHEATDSERDDIKLDSWGLLRPKSAWNQSQFVTIERRIDCDRCNRPRSPYNNMDSGAEVERAGPATHACYV